jgi:hypothetical protein
MFKVSSDIYFIVYNLYYVSQNNDLGTRARSINRDEGSTFSTDNMFKGHRSRSININCLHNHRPNT